MLLRLFLLFTLVPLADLSILVWIADKTNWMVTLGAIVLPALLGGWLARHEGLRCWRAVREQLARGELPTDSLLDGLLILVAGVLLITPGLLTDTAGLLLLVPPIRRLVRRYVVRHIQVRMAFTNVYTAGPPWDGHQRVVDARVIDVEHHDADSDRDSGGHRRCGHG